MAAQSKKQWLKVTAIGCIIAGSSMLIYSSYLFYKDYKLNKELQDIKTNKKSITPEINEINSRLKRLNDIDEKQQIKTIKSTDDPTNDAIKEDPTIDHTIDATKDPTNDPTKTPTTDPAIAPTEIIKTKNEKIIENEEIKSRESEIKVNTERKTEKAEEVKSIETDKKENINKDIAKKEENELFLFNVFDEQYVESKLNENQRYQKLESTTYVQFMYDPEPNNILCSKSILEIPMIRIFIQLTPQQFYIGCVKSTNLNELCKVNILTGSDKEYKIVLYGNYMSHGFSGTSYLTKGDFYETDNSSFRYKHIQKYPDGIKSGDTVIMKYNINENSLQFFKQKRSDYNTDRMELMYQTNNINGDYHYVIGYRHDKTQKSRKFSYVVSVP